MNRCKNTKDNNIIVPIIASAASLLVIFTAVMAIWIIRKQKTSGMKFNTLSLITL